MLHFALNQYDFGGHFDTTSAEPTISLQLVAADDIGSVVHCCQSSYLHIYYLLFKILINFLLVLHRQRQDVELEKGLGKLIDQVESNLRDCYGQLNIRLLGLSDLLAQLQQTLVQILGPDL